ncbi:hypothetical protein HPB48_022196 [Haemaphysalis longicornis]|uniref:Caveolin n=1 Tax=Haemaphysalis longicornis TaxID=44386 RepID=A0A9J6FM71_HAELO|nr:hypothetical protein HPB48_022196 [Haemaphysalis longicornis]
MFSLKEDFIRIFIHKMTDLLVKEAGSSAPPTTHTTYLYTRGDHILNARGSLSQGGRKLLGCAWVKQRFSVIGFARRVYTGDNLIHVSSLVSAGDEDPAPLGLELHRKTQYPRRSVALGLERCPISRLHISSIYLVDTEADVNVLASGRTTGFILRSVPHSSVLALVYTYTHRKTQKLLQHEPQGTGTEPPFDEARPASTSSTLPFLDAQQTSFLAARRGLVFEDVIAEPDASHGFDGAWKLTYLVFSSTRLWCYRLLAALLALPCGLTWGLLFSVLSLVHVWLITPSLRVFDVFLHVVHRVWGGLVRTLLDPVFQSIGKVAGDVRVTRTQVYPKNDFAHDP